MAASSYPTPPNRRERRAAAAQKHSVGETSDTVSGSRLETRRKPPYLKGCCTSVAGTARRRGGQN